MSKIPTGGRQFLRLLFTLTTLVGLMACSYRSTDSEVPAANNQGIEKSFFFESNNKPKTFLCGWATEQGIGSMGEQNLTQNVPLADHCNMVFEITENRLLGKMINPSFPDDSSRWETILTIPIKSHYYYEAEKDSRGRDTQKMIENSSRSHWSARPYMTLDLSGIDIQKWSYNLFAGNGGKVAAVDEIEWDKANGFLGFTVAAAGTYASGGKPNSDSDFQARFRFNFLAFQHNPNFKRTPFSDKDYKYMNILHVMGKKLNGTYQIMSAAHWDFSKKHEIYLQGFPPEYIGIGEKVVDDWNQSLREVGALKEGQTGFVVNKTALKHTFDLRYPTMVWLADERLSEFSPLGIAMAHADVKNGEILWGGITLYGGMLESYIKAYSENSSGVLAKGKSAVGTLARMFSAKFFPKEMKLPEGLREVPGVRTGAFLPERMSQNAQILTKELKDGAQKKGQELLAGTPAQKIEASGLLANGTSAVTPEMLQKMLTKVHERAGQVIDGRPIAMSDLRAQLFPNYSEKMDESEQQIAGQMTPDKVSSMIRASVKKTNGGNIACLDRTFDTMGEQWATAYANSGRSFDEVMHNVVTELISHEYGHFLGLGHQFKENILPAAGSVPEKQIAALKNFANAKEGFTNYSSVMGYRAPETEIAQKEAVVPGPHDKLVLRFLYNQEYATFKAGDPDFSFAPVPETGIIPEKTGDKNVAYFPQCNDTDASLGFDPYCNRFDRGANAEDIVKNYFSGLDSNLIQNLIAMSDSRNSPAWAVEGRLWSRAFSNLGRVRFFYDYMRYKYRGQIDKFRGEENTLFKFASACKTNTAEEEEAIKSEELIKIFKANPEFKELCRANAYALDKMKSLVNITSTDFTKYDIDNRYSPGGIGGGEIDRDETRFVGTWTEMTAIPLKFSALYALTTASPWVNVGGWMLPVFTYDNPSMRFAYSSLYPQEFTQIMAENVRANLKFASLGRDERTTLGQSVLAMSFFNYLSSMSNDAQLFPEHYIKQINNQTNFDFKIVAVLMDGKPNVKKTDADRVTKFKTDIYDFETGRSSPAKEGFLLPDGIVIATAENTFLLPITPFQLLEDKMGYVIAIRMNYYHQDQDVLEKISVKSGLQGLYDKVVKACVDGGGGGLSAFFNSETKTYPNSADATHPFQFEGFYMPNGLARDQAKQTDFLKSISSNFETYYNKVDLKPKPDPATCREALRGIALIVSTAAVVNGNWIGPVGEMIQK